MVHYFLDLSSLQPNTWYNVSLPHPCWVYKPNNPYGKFWVDEWIDLYEAPVSWSSATICVGEGWAEEDDYEAITHWADCTEPTLLVKLSEEPSEAVTLGEEPEE